MPEELLARYRIVTPMFLGGADRNCDGSLRAPSVKGALRFWWRALNWPRIRATTDDMQALRDLHREEARLFGLPAREEDGRQTGGQGAFLMTVRPVGGGRLHIVDKDKVHLSFQKVTAARYLGYGLMGAFGANAARLERDCIEEAQHFEVRLRFRKHIEPGVVDPLKALGLLGGLGSRARHGMGSIALESLVAGERSLFSAPETEDDYQACIRSLFDEPGAGTIHEGTIPGEPPFTAFSKDARIDRLIVGTDPYKVLDAFALAMMRYRSWGQSIKGNKLPDGSASEKRFQDDHDWFRVVGWRSYHKDFHPQRVIFGLPHNYSKSTNDHVTAANFERRASALMVHVHPVGNRFLSVSTFLPARFLPLGERINAGGTNVPVATDWRVVTDLLDGKVGNPPGPGAPDRFPGKQRILP